MKLSEMQDIATPLGRELPELAGGAPTWPIYVPPFEARIAAAIKAKESAQGKGETNLFATNQPTIMERWELLSIWVPAVGVTGFAAELTTAELAEVRWLLTLNIRYGNDIIWSGARSPQTLEPAGTELIANFVAAENFINPLPIERGRGLTLEAIENVWFPKETTLQTFTLLSRVWIGGTGVKGRVPNEGTIQYLIRPLTGHRAL